MVSVPKDLCNMYSHWSCLGCWRKLQYMYTDCVVVAVHLINPGFCSCCSFSSSLYSSLWLLMRTVTVVFEFIGLRDFMCHKTYLGNKQTKFCLHVSVQRNWDFLQVFFFSFSFLLLMEKMERVNFQLFSWVYRHFNVCSNIGDKCVPNAV